MYVASEPFACHDSYISSRDLAGAIRGERCRHVLLVPSSFSLGVPGGQRERKESVKGGQRERRIVRRWMKLPAFYLLDAISKHIF